MYSFVMTLKRYLFLYSVWFIMNNTNTDDTAKTRIVEPAYPINYGFQ